MWGRLAPKLPGWNSRFGSPGYEAQVSGSGQTVFTTTKVQTAANTANKTNLAVYVNGVYQEQGSTKAYTVTGANQVTFNSGLTLNSDVVFISFA